MAWGGTSGPDVCAPRVEPVARSSQEEKGFVSLSHLSLSGLSVNCAREPQSVQIVTRSTCLNTAADPGSGPLVDPE